MYPNGTYKKSRTTIMVLFQGTRSTGCQRSIWRKLKSETLRFLKSKWTPLGVAVWATHKTSKLKGSGVSIGISQRHRCRSSFQRISFITPLLTGIFADGIFKQRTPFPHNMAQQPVIQSGQAHAPTSASGQPSPPIQHQIPINWNFALSLLR